MPSQNQFLPGHKQKHLFFFISVTPKAKVAHTSLLSEFRGRGRNLCCLFPSLLFKTGLRCFRISLPGSHEATHFSCSREYMHIWTLNPKGLVGLQRALWFCSFLYRDFWILNFMPFDSFQDCMNNVHSFNAAPHFLQRVLLCSPGWPWTPFWFPCFVLDSQVAGITLSMPSY